MKDKKKIISYIILSILFIALTFITVSVIKGDEILLDTVVYNFISENVIRDELTPIIRSITWFGSTKGILIIGLLILLLNKVRRERIEFVSNLTLVTIINQTIKFLIKRPRPNINRLVKQGGYSFPSGHSMVSIVFYGYLIYLINKKVKNKIFRFFGTILLSLLILFIGLSRIYLGVHYTTDVLAGFILGGIQLYVFNKVTKRYEKENL